MEIGVVVSIIITLVLAFIPYLRNRYLHGSKLTMEMDLISFLSVQIGTSPKNEVLTKDGISYIDGNNAIRFFELTWKFKLIMRNNSDNTAYYPKVYFDKSKPKFTKIDPLNE